MNPTQTSNISFKNMEEYGVQNCGSNGVHILKFISTFLLQDLVFKCQYIHSRIRKITENVRGQS